MMIIRLLTVLLVLMLSTAARAQTAPQTSSAPSQRFRLVGSTLQLEPGVTDTTLTVAVLANLQAADLQSGTEATLSDETPLATGTSVTATSVTPTDALQQVWRFAVTVKGLGKAESQARVFVISFGRLRETLAYTLSNTPSKTFTWSVKAAPEWNLGSMQALSVPIRTGEVEATGIVLQQAALSGDDKLKRTLGTEHFVLCSNASGECTEAGQTQPPRSARTLYVRPSGPLPTGIFKGNLLIAAAEKTDPEVLAITLYSPRADGALLGWLALVAGVLVSLLVQVFVRTWVQRRQDKAAIALLRKRFHQVVADFGRLPGELKVAAEQWKADAARFVTDMKDLDDLVRSRVPQPFADEVTSVETLKAGIERHARTALHLRTLLRDGLERVAVILRDKPAVKSDAETAARDIASLGAADDVATKIREILVELRRKAAAPPVVTLAADRRAPGAEFQSLRLQIAALSLAVWLLWAGVSVISGALLLIYQNPAFGTEYDLLVCLAWGLGVTVAGQQASQLGPSGVAQSIGIKLPGAK